MGWPYLTMSTLEHNYRLLLDNLRKPRPPQGCFRNTDICYQNSKWVPSFSIRNVRQELLLNQMKGAEMQLVALTLQRCRVNTWQAEMLTV